MKEQGTFSNCKLPTEIWTIVLLQVTNTWEVRWNLAKVCRQWREIICYHNWNDMLTISGKGDDTWPPFYNVKSIRIERECTVNLLQKINEKYTNLQTIEFGMFSTKSPANKNEILSFLKTMKLSNIIIGTAYNWISSENIHFLSNCTKCDLSNCISIDGEDLRYLLNCKALNLSLQTTNPGCDKIRDQNISSLVNLTELNITCRSWIFDEGLQNLEQLKRLTINNCKILGNSFASFKQLTYLSYHRCAVVEYNHFGSLSSLISVDLSNSAISNDSLKYFSHVKTVILNYCIGISGLGLSYLINVEQLYLVGCKQLVDNSIKQIYPFVKKISLRGCSKLTDESLEYLSKFPKNVNVKNCPLISKKSVEAAKSLHTIVQSDFDLICSFRK